MDDVGALAVEYGYVPGDKGTEPWNRAAEPPAGYPEGYECAVYLRDGRRVRFRPVVPADGDRLLFIRHNAKDPEDVRTFFRARHAHLSDDEVRALCTVDYRDTFALAGFADDGQFVAFGQYGGVLRDPGRPVTAMAAVATGWNYRSQGLGAETLRQLAVRANECGIDMFCAFLQPQAIACRKIIEHTGGHLAAYHNDSEAMYFGRIGAIV